MTAQCVGKMQIAYIRKAYYIGEDYLGTGYAEDSGKNIYCCVKMVDHWGISGALQIKFGDNRFALKMHPEIPADNDIAGLFSSRLNSKAAVYIECQEVHYEGSDTKHYEIRFCPFCGAGITFNMVKDIRVEVDVKSVSETVKITKPKITTKELIKK